MPLPLGLGQEAEDGGGGYEDAGFDGGLVDVEAGGVEIDATVGEGRAETD